LYGNLKTVFPILCKEIEKGNRINILHDQTGQPLAVIVPYTAQKTAKQKIGLLDGKIKIEFKDDFEMTAERKL
jgi:antitoxin (DNA-binding transcriptional repressor) of toxin-antitoxin stability system